MLWPSRLAGPLDGAPLDTRADAILIGLVLPALFVLDRRILSRAPTRVLIVALLMWKAALAASTAQDGWCVRFESPVPLFVEQERVPHAWDVRADWRSHPPRCSAVMTRGYHSILEFPVWFYNLPPATWLQPAKETERPPYVTLGIDVSGVLSVSESGVFSAETGDGVRISATIDGRSIDGAALSTGVPLDPGSHQVSMTGSMTGEQWKLVPQWNRRDVWQGSTATMTAPRAIDDWLRPWGKWITTLLIGALIAIGLVRIAKQLDHRWLIALTAGQSLLAIAAGGRQLLMRSVPLVLAAAALVKIPRRLQNITGAQWLIGVPFMVLIAVRGLDEIGRVTWYTIGDDWWLFQRFAYRIYLQGYWLEAGEPSFWFQPFYRWIAGALHMVFGDSSIGELFWDGACSWAGALFAFHVVRTTAGFRWGAVAAVTTLALLTIGPGWYLFGRGLSEMTSAGLIYSAALLVLRGRRGDRLPLILAGLCAAIAFYTRLNNLLFAAAVVTFSLPLRQRAGDWWHWRSWLRRCSRPAIVAIVAAMIGAVVLFGLRSYYYTGSVNALSGTQASARSVWQTTDEGLTPAQNLMGSVLMVVTMSDSPRLEPRAIPVVAGILCAVFALLGVRGFRELPMNVSLLCVAGLAGAFVARGSAYPGRFSIHLIPVAVALSVAMLARITRGRRPAAGGGA